MRRFYWIKEGLRIASTILGACLLYGFFISVMNGEDNTWQDNVKLGIVYLGMCGAVMALMFNMSAYQTIVPLSLSFGCTRREALQGLQIYRLFALLPLAAAMTALAVLMTGQMEMTPGAVVLLTMVAYLSCTGIGGLLGTLVPKMSKGALTAVTMLGVFGALAAVGGTVVALRLIGLTDILLWTVLGFGVLIYGVCSLVEVRAVKRCCVR